MARASSTGTSSRGNLSPDGAGREDDFIKVLDFGLVKQMRRRDEKSPTLTSDGAIVGTPLYMAPERFHGDEESDHRADLYALGAVAYFLVTGRPVFDAKNSVQVLLQQARNQPSSLRSRGVTISEKLDDAILRALEKDPEARFSGADEFRLALRETPEWSLWSQLDAENWWRSHVVDQPAPELVTAADLI